MTQLERVLANVLMDVVVTLRSARPDGLDPDDAERLTEEALGVLRSGLADASGEEQRALALAFQERADREGVAERKAAAVAFAESMRPALGQSAQAGLPQGVVHVLAKAVMDLLLAIELADDDVIDPDDAVKVTEWAAADLQAGMARASEEDRHQLIGHFRAIAASEEDPERRDLALEFPEAMGLMPED
ncbi:MULTISPECIES: hypothetical protein [unclassified Streptomyces]|uniref:hypothetical protein n=1 Tax=unclassified Streptomyces TaxID=2593676 RepID=UPI00340EF5DA